jgi:tight adherence protein B
VVRVSTWQRLPVVRTWVERRSTARRDAQLPEALERMAAALRAGRSLTAALGEVGDATAAPLGDELGVAVTALRHGAALEHALGAWRAAAGPSPEVALATTAIGLGGRTGGEVARALDRVAATLRERRELRAEVRALATQARASAGVLIVAPPAFALLASTVEPGVAGFLLTSPAGLACLGAGLALDGLGAHWMGRIVAAAT